MLGEKIEIKDEKIDLDDEETLQTPAEKLQNYTKSRIYGQEKYVHSQVCEVKVEEKKGEKSETVIERTSFQSSEIYDSNNPYFCAACIVDFEEKIQFFIHILTNHDGEKSIKCPICEYPLSDELALRKHIKIVHERKKQMINPISENIFSEKIPEINDEKISNGFDDYSEAAEEIFSDNFEEKNDSDPDYVYEFENEANEDITDDFSENKEPIQDEVEKSNKKE